MHTIAKTHRAMRFFLLACVTTLVSAHVDATELSPEKPIKLIGREIEVVLDLRKKEARINRFSVDKMIPTGKLQHQLAKPYVVPLVSIPKIDPDDITTLQASDWYDGIGLKLQIKLLYVDKAGKWRGDINITSQHEETILYYSAQQLDVRQE